MKHIAKQGAGTTEAKFDTNNLGVRIPMGDFTFNAGVSDGKALLPGQAVKADMSGVQLSVWYALNKDTTVYGVYGTEKIKHASFTSTADEKTMLVGIRYKF